MSIVCAIREPGKGVWMGADSQTTANHMYDVAPLDKWVVNGKWALGVAGDVRALNILHAHKKHVLKATQTPFKIANSIKSSMESLDVPGKQSGDGGGNLFPLGMILTNGKKIWSVGGDLSMIELPTFCADGSGEALARGAFYALQNKPTKKTMETCLMAACANEIHCRPPLKIELMPE